MRVSSIRSSCMYEVADFFIIIGLYVFQIRIQFCNFFFFFLFLFNHAQVTEVFHESIISILSLCLRENFSLIQESRNQKGKEVIYMQTVLEFRKKKYSCYIVPCAVFSYFFSFFLFLFS